MAAPPAFREVSAEAYVHATESEEAVTRAIAGVIPGARIERRGLGGHFGQPLVLLSARSSDRSCVAAAVAVLRRAAGAQIAAEASRRVSEDLLLHVRVDKQAAAQGAPRLPITEEGDVVLVRFRLRAPRLTAPAAAAIVKDAFGAPEKEEEE